MADDTITGTDRPDADLELQTYEQQEQQARAELADLDSTFTAAVAGILGIAAEQGATHLAAAVAEQQHLQAAEVSHRVPATCCNGVLCSSPWC
jgi:Flp pilus assembly CpaE family ATPase